MSKGCLLILLTSSVVFMSCKTSRYIYSPSPPNNPSFEKKGDSKLAAYYSGGGSKNTTLTKKNNGYDIQAAYAITDKWAMTGSYFSRKETDAYFVSPMTSWSNIYDSSVVRYNRHIMDVGGGYFAPLDRKRTVWFNCYTGIGLGRFSFNENGSDSTGNYSRAHKSNIIKWFLQPGLTIHGGKYFRVILSGRLSLVDYSNISTSYNSKQLEYFNLHKLSNGALTFIEPSTAIQFIIPGCEWLSAEAGMTLSTDAFLAIGPRARNSCIFVGLDFDFSKLKKN